MAAERGGQPERLAGGGQERPEPTEMPAPEGASGDLQRDPGEEARAEAASSGLLEAEMREKIAALEEAHRRQVAFLEDSHYRRVVELEVALAQTRVRVEELEAARAGEAEEVRDLKNELKVIRQSYTLTQSQLTRALVDQDTLLDTLHLIEQETRDRADDSEKLVRGVGSSADPFKKLFQLKVSDLDTFLDTLHGGAFGAVSETQAPLLREVAEYYRKLLGTEPMRLCRLLEISFDPDRSFALSNSLLEGLTVDWNCRATDRQLLSGDAAGWLFKALLCEIATLRKNVNDVSAAYIKRVKKEAALALDRSAAKNIVDAIVDDSLDMGRPVSPVGLTFPLMNKLLTRFHV